ncbi:MAG TPA: hypothetical protein PK668_08345 [Myxococcota bacterium]|nr:hypothetical protein [Myxococcota bacterium]HRY93014.1 hypothetical protein [Myxococcota bacterium]HSA20253.1 hypothetical protein [Myxococcota bacterium]
MPRTSASVWLLFVGFLLPPALVVWFGRTLGPLPYQTVWVVLLGLPALILVLMLPRKYTLDAEALVIHGAIYRLRVPRSRIRAVRPVSALRALSALGSVFCSDPGHALAVERERGVRLIISPRRPGPFLDLDPAVRQAREARP